MRLIDRFRDIGRAILYTATFKLLFTVLKAAFRLLLILLSAGFFYPFFYLLFGVILKLFFGFEPIFWDMKTQLYTAGLVFWTLVGTAAAIKKTVGKIRRINMEYAEKKFKRILEAEEREYCREELYYQKQMRRADRRERRRRRKERFDGFFFG
ncbi:MAG: hypothetical protein LBQ40_00025 [Clostridiales bacterium]|jgi:hypothetical protein|nr:hypothetical protein [Clostridiales bacterium]